MEYRHPIITMGPYQVVALTPSASYDSAEIVGYAVVTASGVKLRHELSFEDARLWLEMRLEEDDGGVAVKEQPRSERSVRPTRHR